MSVKGLFTFKVVKKIELENGASKALSFMCTLTF